MSDHKKYKWHCIALSPEELQLNENGIATVEVNGKKICVTQYKDQWYGFAYKCPHASGLMSEGYVDAVGNITCPLHRYKFSLANGRNTSGEGYYLKTYPVEMREEGLFIGLADTGFFHF